MTIRAISLFSGAGGIDLGFRRAGVKVVWANDFNASACETYKANFGNEIHCGSLMDFDYNALPDCDLVFGGPPCQGFSVAGKMDPKDPRSKLVFEFQKKLLDCYRRMGYAVRFEILDSQHYNTPQRRERLIMIGTLCGADAICFPKKSRHVITAREVLAGFDEPGTGNNKGVCDARITTAKSPVLRTSPYAGMLFNGMGRPIDLSRPCQTLPASMGGNKTPIIDTRLLRNPDSPDWLKRLHAKAMRGEDISGVKVPQFMRRITVSEAAALQGFPKEFKFLGSRCDKYRQIGNSVPPPLAEAIAREVVKAMLKSNR